jgi:hypothetical protein
MVLAWTLRVSPHLYRRSEVTEVARATAPFSEADAAKRLFNGAKPLQSADLPVLPAMAEVAKQQRAIVRRPTVKGAVSTALTQVLDPPYLTDCRPCGCTHCRESLFRIATLQGGLELLPDSSPPVLQRIPGFRPPYFAGAGTPTDPRFEVVRNYLRFFGPARPADAAVFLDSSIAEVSAHWPTDTVAVEVTDGPQLRGDRSILASDAGGLVTEPEKREVVKLLGPYDAYLQARDRALLVADGTRAKGLWRTLGRPGAVAVDGEIVGTWRPKSSGKKLTVLWDPWVPVTARLRTDVTVEAERLAALRDQRLDRLAEAP